MLKTIVLKNFFLLENLHLELSPHFNVLTGETGAGKSILLAAVQLGLGQKIKNHLIQPGKERLEVALTFSLSAEKLATLPLPREQKAVSSTPQPLTLRRQINQGGRSVCHLGHQPVTLAKLQEIGALLVDFHSQHQNQTLFNPKTHREVLDKFLHLENLLAQHQKNYHTFKTQRAELQQLLQKEKKIQEEKDFLNFTRKELAAQLISPAAFEASKAQLRELERAEQAREKFFQLEKIVVQTLLPALEEAAALLYEKEATPKSFEATKLENALKEVEALTERLKNQALARSQVEKIDALHKKLVGVERLRRKYALDLKALWEKKETVEKKCALIENLSEEKKNRQREYYLAKREALKTALKLRVERRHGMEAFAGQIKEEINDLGMHNAKLKVGLTPEKLSSESEAVGLLGEGGVDEVEFTYVANKGVEAKPLAKIASGGEISRLMLALKVLLSKTLPAVTMVLDEIDTGVGGEIALQLGKKIKTLGQAKQVFVITHLPQLAKYAERHLRIVKKTTTEKTSSQVMVLDETSRLSELARMLGKENSSTSVQLAKEFMQDKVKNKEQTPS